MSDHPPAKKKQKYLPDRPQAISTPSNPPREACRSRSVTRAEKTPVGGNARRASSMHPATHLSAHKIGVTTSSGARGPLPAQDIQKDIAPPNLFDEVNNAGPNRSDGKTDSDEESCHDDEYKSSFEEEREEPGVAARPVTTEVIELSSSPPRKRKDSGKKNTAKHNAQIAAPKVGKVDEARRKRESPVAAVPSRKRRPAPAAQYIKEESIEEDEGGEAKVEVKVKVDVMDGNQKIRDRAVSAYVLKVFKALCGLQDTKNVNEPLFDDNKKPVYFIGDILYPQWDLSFTDNMKVWGTKWDGTAADQSRMSGPHEEYLKSRTSDDFRNALRGGAFGTMARLWKLERQGKLNDYSNAKKILGRRNDRKKKKAKVRRAGLEGLDLDPEHFGVFADTDYQSSEYSDVDDASRLVIDDREFEDEKAKSISAALFRRGSAGKRKIAANAKKNFSHFKADVDIPELKPGKRVPGWIISQTWIGANEEKELYLRPRIDHAQAVMPQADAVEQLLAGYPPLAKTYVDERPRRAGHGLVPEVPALVNAPIAAPAPAPAPVPAPAPAPAPAPNSALGLALNLDPALAPAPHPVPQFAPDLGLAPAPLPPAFAYNPAQAPALTPAMMEALFTLMSQCNGYLPAPASAHDHTQGGYAIDHPPVAPQAVYSQPHPYMYEQAEGNHTEANTPVMPPPPNMHDSSEMALYKAANSAVFHQGSVEEPSVASGSNSSKSGKSGKLGKSGTSSEGKKEPKKDRKRSKKDGNGD
ncbi:hypothetical protein FRC09_014986 [Ceratobasidium sp. 395]|nr:hypothetical protein FRC09_014986 [Ceratobasidium sp. 395]